MSVIYNYDGSYEGLMCCVFESFQRRETPAAIELFDEAQGTLFQVREIMTDTEKAARVKKSIPIKICDEAEYIVERAFLTNLDGKELHILKFLQLGFKVGRKVCGMLTQENVDVLKKAVHHLSHEAHLLLGFIRFSEYDGVLLSSITPKNRVLPVIAPHFCERLSQETFMIFDKTHHTALIYRDGVPRFIELDSIEEPPAGPEELMYRGLWKKFYDTIGIEGRYNPRCRMTMMPKRYWENMTEFNME